MTMEQVIPQYGGSPWPKPPICVSSRRSSRAASDTSSRSADQPPCWPDCGSFPAARVEEGETDAQALKREVRERVGVEVEVGACIGRRTHDYDGYSVDLALYQARIVGDVEPTAVRVADCRWVTSGEFEKYRFPAADQATMDLLLGIKRG